MNMVKVLRKAGCKVNYNPNQTCCGQPAFNSGFWGDAKEIGEKFIRDFDNSRYIVCPSGSCTGYIRNFYPELFENSALHNNYKSIQSKLFEFSEFMTDVLKVTDVGARLNGHASFATLMFSTTSL